MSSGVNIALSGLKATQKQLKNIGSNIANKDTPGFKKEVMYTCASHTGGADVTSYTNVDLKGNITETDVSTDLAIDGSGLFTVADSSGERTFVSTGSFAPNKDGIMEMQSKAGAHLQGWSYENGESLSTELDKIQIKNEIAAKATKELKANVQLSSKTLSNSEGGSLVLKKGDIDKSKANSSFILSHIKSELGKEHSTKSKSYTFGGFVEVDTATANLNKISVSGASASPISITKAEIDTAISGGTLDTLFQDKGLRLILNDSGKLSIAAQDANTDIKCDLLDSSSNTLSSTSTQNISSSKMFANMEEFIEKAKDDFLDISVSGDYAVFFARANENTSFSEASSDSGILAEMGISNDSSFTIQSSYDPYSNNIAAGKAKADFSSNMKVYDSTGRAHSISSAMKKISPSDWICETYVDNPSDIVSNDSGGLLQVSKISFTDKGELASVSNVSQALYSDLYFNTPSDAVSSTITADGTTYSPTSAAEYVYLANKHADADAALIKDDDSGKYRIVIRNPQGTHDGFSKRSLDKPSAKEALNIKWQNYGIYPDSESNIDFNYEAIALTSSDTSSGAFEADGYAAGTISNIEIDTSGDVIGSYNNNKRVKIAKIAVAAFPDFNKLEKDGGNASTFHQTSGSGSPKFLSADSGRVGKVLSSHLEGSAVDLQNELPAMVVQQQAYQANTLAMQKNSELISNLIRSMNS